MVEGIKKMSSSKRLSGIKERLKKESSSSNTSPTTLGVATLSRSASRRSTSLVPPNVKPTSLIEGETLGEDNDTANGSKPSNAWCNRHRLTATSTGDQTTVNVVLTEKVFPKIQFVDRETQLMFSDDKHLICQFVIWRCNIHSDISLPNWWKQV